MGEVIYISSSAFSTIVSSALETYDNECTGLLFGYINPDPDEARYEVWSVIPHQIVYDRARNFVTEDPMAYHRLKTFQEKVIGYSTLGGFHSHPEATPYRSKLDLNYLKEKNHYVEVIISIREIDEDRSEWKISKDDMECHGSFIIGSQFYKIRMIAYYLKGNRAFRLAIRSGYIEILEDLIDFGFPTIHTVADVYKQARDHMRDIYPITELLIQLEENQDQIISKRKKTVKKIKEYLGFN